MKSVAATGDITYIEYTAHGLDLSFVIRILEKMGYRVNTILHI